MATLKISVHAASNFTLQMENSKSNVAIKIFLKKKSKNFGNLLLHSLFVIGTEEIKVA